MALSEQDRIEPDHSAADRRQVSILVNTKHVLVPARVSGAGILAAAGLPADFNLFRVRGNREIPVAPDELVHVREGERFVACPSLDPAFLLSPEHAWAVESVRDAFPANAIAIDPRANGSTTITVRGLMIGEHWSHPAIDLTVTLQPTFPSTPPYPFYGPPGLQRADGRVLPQLQPHVEHEGKPRAQISLSSPFEPTLETLGARLVGVVAWLRKPG